jgi:hypothetical protein
MKNRLLISIIINTKEERGKIKEENILEREPVGRRRVFVVTEIHYAFRKGVFNYQLFQINTFCCLYHHPINICRTLTLEYYDDLCRMGWKVAYTE